MSGWGWGGVGSPGGSRREPDSFVRCETCGTTKAVSVVDLVVAPFTVPECCGEPMELPSLAEIEAGE